MEGNQKCGNALDGVKFHLWCELSDLEFPEKWSTEQLGLHFVLIFVQNKYLCIQVYFVVMDE